MISANIVPRLDIYGHLQARVLRYQNSGQYPSISVRLPYITVSISLGTVLMIPTAYVIFSLGMVLMIPTAYVKFPMGMVLMIPQHM